MWRIVMLDRHGTLVPICRHASLGRTVRCFLKCRRLHEAERFLIERVD